MKKRTSFFYLHMSIRVLITLVFTVSVSGLILYCLILKGALKPTVTAEEIKLAAALPSDHTSDSSELNTPAPLSFSAEPALPVQKAGEDASFYTVLLSQYTTLSPGDDNDSVLYLRERLEKLGYMESDESSSVYNDSIAAAVSLFQRVSDLDVTGIADAQLQAHLFSDSAQPYRIVPGDYGTDVCAVQVRLKELGFYHGRTSGYFGPQTEKAVMLFEYQNGLEQDGILTHEDRKQLLSIHAGPNLSSASQDTVHASDSDADSISIYAHTADGLGCAVSDQLDKPYIWGKDGPDAFDCSGLIWYCLRLCGVSVSKTDPEGFSEIDIWTKIEKVTSLKKGDLVFFKGDVGSKIVNAGIALGPASFIHASSSSGKVIMSSLSEPYWERNFVFARRVFNG